MQHCIFCHNPVDRSDFYEFDNGAQACVGCYGEYEENPEASKYQQAIYDEVREGFGHSVVIARAGSGKTYTIIESLKLIPPGKSVLLCAFNKKIKEELERRAPRGVEVATTHSIGFRTVKYSWGNIQVDVNKVYKMVNNILPSGEDADEIRGLVIKLVSLGKNTMAHNQDDLQNLAAAYGIMCSRQDLQNQLIVVADEIMLRCSKKSYFIDYDDMIWLPVIHDMPLKQYDFVFVDETQDLNVCQIELCLRSCKPGGRIIAVGDDRQAMYKFRGADTDAINNMVNRLRAKRFTLPISYRSPRKVIAEAQKYVPDIQVWDQAKEGAIIEKTMEHLIAESMPGDFILSRANAPLTKICMTLLKHGKPAVINGRDIGANLISFIKQSKRRQTEELIVWLGEYRERQISRLIQAHKEELIEEVNDKVDTVFVLAEDTETVEEIINKITKIFADAENTGNRILCSTVHKAKGLEADNVWLIVKTFKPGRNIEEDNIYYVAVTRSKNNLYMVNPCDWSALIEMAESCW